MLQIVGWVGIVIPMSEALRAADKKSGMSCRKLSTEFCFDFGDIIE
jgi:hypothetical protein